MSHPTREDLLGYLLGALDRAEHERVAHELSQNPQLSQDLARLQKCIDRVGLAEQPTHFEPPAGLALRTCQKVAAYQSPHVELARSGFAPAAAEGMQYRVGNSFADLVAMAAVVVAAAALFFPALASSRFQANVSVCQNRLRQLGMALQEYSSRQPDRSYPRVELAGNRSVAGVVAPILVDSGLVADPRAFLCPTSNLGQKPSKWHIPTMDELDAAEGDVLTNFHLNMGGTYAHNLGHWEDGKLCAPIDERRADFAVASDLPSDETRCRRTIHHDRRGQNVLYQDGHVIFVPGSCAVLPDDPFHNLDGEVAAGLNRNDSVLGESSARPLRVRQIKE